MNAMTWFDHDTGSVWSQVTGTALLGPLEGTSLELIPSDISSWADWREDFPNTRALATGTASNTFSVEILAVAARVDDDVAGVKFVDLREAGAVSTELGGVPVIFAAEPGVDRAAVFSREIDSGTLELVYEDNFLVEVESGDRWDPRTGGSIDGRQSLDRVPQFSSNLNNLIDIFPDVEVLIEPEFIRPIPDPVKSFIISME